MNNRPFFCPPGNLPDHASSLNIRDLIDFENGRILSFGDFITRTNMRLNFNQYFFLRRAVSGAINARIIPPIAPRFVTITEFYNNNPNGKKIRNVLFGSPTLDFQNSSPYIFFNSICNSEYNPLQTKKFFFNLFYTEYT